MATTHGADGSRVDAPVAEPLDGDDITVLPDGVPPSSGRRRLWIILAAVVAVVAIAVGIGFAVTRDDTPTTRVQTQPSQPAAVVPVPVSNVPKKLPAAVAPPTAPAATAKTTPNVVASSPASTPNAAAPAPTAAPQPQTSPPSALQWTAPASISVKHGAKTTIHVTAHNPTKGTITLPNPLSCAPTLDNSGFCVEMAQLLKPGESASATYTIDATNIAAGHYTLAIEGGLLKIPATVTS